jgi:hypothetical protein
MADRRMNHIEQSSRDRRRSNNILRLFRLQFENVVFGMFGAGIICRLETTSHVNLAHAANDRVKLSTRSVSLVMLQLQQLLSQRHDYAT